MFVHSEMLIVGFQTEDLLTKDPVDYFTFDGNVSKMLMHHVSNRVVNMECITISFNCMATGQN